MQYRADIDGLRAVAVLGVIAFHTGLGFLPGGYLGVDVFFVISGFLITRIVSREVEAGTFTFRDFYARRARRLVPALLAVCLATLAAGALWMLPDDYDDLATGVLAALGFVSNFYFFDKLDYFAPSTELNAIIHTWSLGIEEQFYLFFPVLFLFAARFGRRLMLLLPLVLSVASIAAAEAAFRIDASAAFFWTPFRVWEFGVGILLALAAPTLSGRAREVAAGSGLAMLALAMLFYQAEAKVPGLAGLVPVAGAALLVAFGSGTATGRLLSWRPLVGVGLVSYSAYLWHQPVFAMARLRFFGDLEPWHYAPLSLVVLLLAWASWRWVEQPFRHRSTMPTRPFATATIAAGAATVVAAASVVLMSGLPSRVAPEALAVLADRGMPSRAVRRCQKARRSFDPVTACLYNAEDATSKPLIALVGDSHGGMLADTLAKAADARGYGLLQLTANGCLPVHMPLDDLNAKCREFRAQLRSVLARDDLRIEKVVVGARWAFWMHDGTLHNGVGGAERMGGAGKSLPAAARIADMEPHLRDFLREQRARGRDVAILGTVPAHGWNVPRMMAYRTMHGTHDTAPSAIPASYYTLYDAPVRALWERLPAGLATVIDPSRALCADGWCKAVRDGRLLYSDDDHVNDRGAAPIVAMIVDALLPRYTSELQKR